MSSATLSLPSIRITKIRAGLLLLVTLGFLGCADMGGKLARPGCGRGAMEIDLAKRRQTCG